MAKPDKDEKPPAVGRPQILRRYEGAGKDRDFGGMSREERKDKYDSDTAAFRHAEIEKSRGELVLKYRASPQAYPDGIDSKYDRWYRDEDWNAKGDFVGGCPSVRPANPEPGTSVDKVSIKPRGRKPKGDDTQ